MLKKGAEADVYLTSWNGKKTVLKIRKEKNIGILLLIFESENKERLEKHK